MIVNLRGTNGSGKSTIVKCFLQMKPYIEVFGVLGPRRPEAYKVRLPNRWLYAIGPYQTNTGGIDAMPLSSGELIVLLEKYRKLGHIIFEGVIISTFYGAVGEWLCAHKDEAIVGFMDTPLDVCLEALASRKSGHRGTEHVAGKIKAIARVKERMYADGLRTTWLARETAFETVKGWLK